MDKGPWRATSLYVGSDDFTHDVSLEINGDFDVGERDKYAEWLAKELNDCPALRDRLSLAEKVVEAAEWRTRNGCDDLCIRSNPCICGNVALRAALAALRGGEREGK